MFAEELGTHDVNALASTSREMNMLLVRLMYLRAKDSTTKRGRPYFLLAVDEGNLRAVEQFIEVGALVNMTDNVTSLPETAIHSCAYFGHVEIAELLIDTGINVSAVDRFGDGALHNVMIGLHPKEAMMTLLVEAGADIEAIRESFMALHVTALHQAAMSTNFRMVKCLLNLGADPNAADEFGRRPWDMVTDDDSGTAIRLLLEEGGDDRHRREGHTRSYW